MQLNIMREIAVLQISLSCVMPTKASSKEIYEHGKSLLEACDKLQKKVKEIADDATDA